MLLLSWSDLQPLNLTDAATVTATDLAARRRPATDAAARPDGPWHSCTHTHTLTHTHLFHFCPLGGAAPPRGEGESEVSLVSDTLCVSWCSLCLCVCVVSPSPPPRRERHRSKSPRRHRSRSRDRRHRSKSPGESSGGCCTSAAPPAGGSTSSGHIGATVALWENRLMKSVLKSLCSHIWCSKLLTDYQLLIDYSKLLIQVVAD